jgi:Fe-S-cluster containining protein
MDQEIAFRRRLLEGVPVVRPGRLFVCPGGTVPGFDVRGIFLLTSGHSCNIENMDAVPESGLAGFSVVSRELAYAGETGSRREKFCLDYTSAKRKVFSRLQSEIFARIEADRAIVTCHQGCSACCVEYIEADIQECEAIVYYLYQRPELLNSFLERYEEWRYTMRRLGGPFALCEEFVHRQGGFDLTPDDQSLLLKAMSSYHEQGIPCPFLGSDACSIHEVRPYVCLNHYVTTPSEWCREKDWYGPDPSRRPRIYMTSLDQVHGLEFYQGALSRPVIGFMPTTVYRILSEGLKYIVALTGKDFSTSPEAGARGP